MLWRGRRQSDNIEDLRGQGGLPGGFGRSAGGGPLRIPIGGRTGGGMSISTLVMLAVIYFGAKFLFGVDLLQLLSGDGSGTMSGNGRQLTETNSPANDEMRQFVATVLAETEDTWSGIFQSVGETYEEPTLTLFAGAIN